MNAILRFHIHNYEKLVFSDPKTQMTACNWTTRLPLAVCISTLKILLQGFFLNDICNEYYNSAITLLFDATGSNSHNDERHLRGGLIEYDPRVER